MKIRYTLSRDRTIGDDVIITAKLYMAGASGAHFVVRSLVPTKNFSNSSTRHIRASMKRSLIERYTNGVR